MLRLRKTSFSTTGLRDWISCYQRLFKVTTIKIHIFYTSAVSYARADLGPDNHGLLFRLVREDVEGHEIATGFGDASCVDAFV